jgi:RecG-like helicase
MTLTHTSMNPNNINLTQVSVLHGELQGIDRDRVMNEFRQGISKVIVATSVFYRVSQSQYTAIDT